FFARGGERFLCDGAEFEKMEEGCMREIAHALSHAAEVMKAYPRPHLLEEREHTDPWSKAALEDFSACYDEWRRLRNRLASIAEAAEVRGRARRRTRPVNEHKRRCAEFALGLLQHFTFSPASRPTLTGGSPFYQLAAALYAATTGEPFKEDACERACRAVFPLRRRR